MSQLTLLEPSEAPRQAPRPAGIEPWRAYPGLQMYHGECVDVMRALRANSIDAGVTDPPYGIGFMGKEWDSFKPDAQHIVEASTRENKMRESNHPNLRGRQRSPGLSPSAIEYDLSLTGLRGFQLFTEKWARELLRVLKPGAYVLVNGAPRSAHRLFCGLEDAGFWICDSLAWLFGQGFPKSHNVGCRCDSEPVLGSDGLCTVCGGDPQWNGWGSALKPGHEPIALAQKPFTTTIEENIARYGVGALNINGCRIASAGDRDPRDGIDGEVGRWPANVVIDEDAAALLDAQTGERRSGANPSRRGSSKFGRVFNGWPSGQECVPARGFNAGGASRFYYVAKPSRAERDFGCEDLPVRTAGECTDRQDGSAGLTPYAGAGRSGGGRNFHPTVKPVELMRWMVRLITPSGATVIDPFLGSGTTGMACALEGCEFIGIEREADYLVLPDARISAVLRELGKI